MQVIQGLELSERYYNEFGKRMLESEFPDVLPYLAVGLVGSGSECFGFDDATSADHDFEPSFCMFIPSNRETVSEKTAFLLEKAYMRLPSEFMGYSRQRVSPAGGARRGVIRISDFYSSKTGSPDGELVKEQWLAVPEYCLAEATNGKIFFDNYGEFTEIRKKLLVIPEDIRLKKLAGNLALTAETGLYNYLRCISHGETAASQLVLFEFEKAVINSVFLLNKKYQPYFKWKHRALKSLPNGDFYSEKLEFLISTPNDYEQIPVKVSVISDITEKLAHSVRDAFNGKATTKSPEALAFELNDLIEDNALRNENIYYAI